MPASPSEHPPLGALKLNFDESFLKTQGKVGLEGS